MYSNAPDILEASSLPKYYEWDKWFSVKQVLGKDELTWFQFTHKCMEDFESTVKSQH